MSGLLNINGQTYPSDSPPETPPLWALGDELKLTGAKYGCGIALCGAGTAHLNGEATRSCQIAIGTIADGKITTIEGLGGTHPLQIAGVARDAPQRGHGPSGQLMSAWALTAKTPKPTDEDIDSAMTEIIGRCGADQRIRRAIKDAAGEGAANAGQPEAVTE